MSCIESNSYWCTGSGQILIVFLILAAVAMIYRFIMKSWSKPRDMSGLSPATGTFSSASETVDGEAEEKDKEEETEEFDIDAAFEAWREENSLPDLTNASVIGEFFKFFNVQEITIVGYDSENRDFLISVVLVTNEIISFYFPNEQIDFKESNQNKIEMAVIFEEYFLENDFTWTEANSVEDSLAKIDWNGEIFTSENCKKIKINITKAAHTKALRTRI